MSDFISSGSTHSSSVEPADELQALRIENEELRRDKERLDWLEQTESINCFDIVDLVNAKFGEDTYRNMRDAIDAAMNGFPRQPDIREASKIGYVCGVAWQHELGVPEMVGPACQVFNSIEQLKEHGCAEECGAVEVEITLRRWVILQDLFKNTREQQQ